MRQGTPLWFRVIETPIGPLTLAGDGEFLCQIRFRGEVEDGWVADEAPFREATAQLRAYFAGELTTFQLPLQPDGTQFQMAVWEELQRIPYGTTISYMELAKRVGRPSAIRAVGGANGSNPLPIVVPCHRVIGSNGKLTGFGGGIDRKQMLLQLESQQLRIL